MPDLHIIDYSVGLPGSQHDTTAWKSTHIPQEHGMLLGADEWVWVDTGHGVSLQRWCQAPYKKPKKDSPKNDRYNYYMSCVHMHSEHWHFVGFLKGQWSSLHGLWLHIDNLTHIRFSVIWVSTCITLHNFSILQEAKEHAGEDIELNEFFHEGMELLLEEQRDREAWDDMVEPEAVSGIPLVQGWLQHEELKKILFDHLGSKHV
ncbi:hypothetical protein K439DRAFT_1334447 [Ramaria rubella]|nr:hypothetical protein K439DRAFT_1334447 [Ramaria rubella]